MQTVQDEVETIHLYVVREQAKKPYIVLPLLCAFLCLFGIAAVTFYSAEHPSYEHQRLTVPAVALPPKVFTATTPIIPTGVKTYPATTAHGILTITNGSVIAQTLPAGLTFISNTGIAVITDEAVFVPAGNANGYGWTQVRAHAVVSGQRGNLPPYSINNVVGSSVYIRNTSSLYGGKDSYSVKYVSSHDKQTALLHARGILALKINGLHYPCNEFYLQKALVNTMTWRCQFVSYHIPAFYHVTSVRLAGKNLLLYVWFIPRVLYTHIK
jgi:hypothetical protein